MDEQNSIDFGDCHWRHSIASTNATGSITAKLAIPLALIADRMTPDLHGRHIWDNRDIAFQVNPEINHATKTPC